MYLYQQRKKIDLLAKVSPKIDFRAKKTLQHFKQNKMISNKTGFAKVIQRTSVFHIDFNDLHPRTTVGNVDTIYE